MSDPTHDPTDDELDAEPEFGEDFDPYSGSGVGWGTETKVFLGILVAGALAGAAWMFLDIPGWWYGDTDIFGNYRYKQEMKKRQARMSPIERVHAEHFPHWLVVRSKPQTFERRDEAEKAYNKIRDALEDETLKSVIADFQAVMDEDNLARHAEKVSTLVDRWNSRLREMGEPFMARLKVHYRGSGSFIFGGFYRKLATPTVGVEDSDYGAMLLKRVDSTNLFEAYLGAARDDGEYTFVITDRIFDFLIQDVLPVLVKGADSEESDPGAVAKVFTEPIRAELKANLDSATYERVVQAATRQAAIEATVKKVRSRRKCGSRFHISSPRWNGYNAGILDRLDKFADKDRLKSCPSIKYEEVETLRDASRFLRRKPTEKALEKLLAWASRVTTAHEIRHRADNAAWQKRRDRAMSDEIAESVGGMLGSDDGGDKATGDAGRGDAGQADAGDGGGGQAGAGRKARQPKRETPEPVGRSESGMLVHYNGPPCTGCTRELSASTRAELSAYTASIAWSGSPKLALFQACTARLAGAHRRALALFLDRLGRLCDETPPGDLQGRARGIEEALFGRSGEITMPSDYPQRLEVRW